jgi:hypothetical protein
VFVDVLDPDRLEGSVSDMQRDRSDLDTARAQIVEHVAREMQTRGWSRHGSRLAGIDGLIPLTIGGVVRSTDVWR